MDTNDRVKRLRELEALLDRLTAKGWRVDACQIILADQEGPFRATIQVSFEDQSALEGILRGG